MTIEEKYNAWQAKLAEIKRGEERLKKLRIEAKEQEQDIYTSIYEKRDEHLDSYGKHTIQSGDSIFSFEFRGGMSANEAIIKFKKISFPSLDD